MSSRNYIETISDDALHKATGRGWQEWFAILDGAEVSKKSHKEMAKWIYDEHLEDGWWAQTIVVGYEQERGLRKPGQRVDGSFSVSVSKTIAASASTLYRIWTEEPAREKWLGEHSSLVISTANADKNIRGKWAEASINVYFYRKGADKTQVTIQLDKLSRAGDAERERAFWKGALSRLKLGGLQGEGEPGPRS